MLTKIREYLDSVCAQIRWKAAHNAISQEVENHIIDQKDAFLADGLDEDAAIDKAVEEMGDAVTVGQQLDRVHRPKPDWIMIAITAAIVILGVALQYIIASGMGNGQMFNDYLSYIPLGIAALVIIYFVDYSILGKYPKIIFASIVAVGFFIRFFASDEHGSRIYLYYMYLLFIPAFSGVVYGQRRKGYAGLLVCGAFYAMGTLFYVSLPAAGGFIQFTIACLVILTVAIAKGWFVVKKPIAVMAVYVPVILFAAIAIIGVGSDYSIRRIMGLFNPLSDPYGSSFISSSAHYILSGAKFLGPADLSSYYSVYPTMDNLPMVNTKLMLTSIIAKFGYAAGIAIILVVGVLIARMFMAAFRQKSALGFMVSLSAALAVTIQSFFYILNNLGFYTIDATFPLIAFDGGTGFIINMALIGIMLSAFRRNEIIRDTVVTGVGTHNKHDKVYKLLNGRITIDLRAK